MFRTMPALAWTEIVARAIRWRNLIAAATIGNAQLISTGCGGAARSRLGGPVASAAWPSRYGAIARICLMKHFAIGSAALVAMSCSIANAESFSIKCIHMSGFYVSFDTEFGKVVEETLSGRPLKGRIDKIDGERIYFHVVIPGTPDMDLVWDGGKKTLTTVPIPGDMTRGRNDFECAATELRSMLSKYDSMPP
jgi:hypothetical protein